MFDILIISSISAVFLTFFIYLHDSLDSDEEEFDLQKYIKYFLLNLLVLSVSTYLYSLFYKTDIDSMNLNVDIPNF